MLSVELLPHETPSSCERTVKTEENAVEQWSQATISIDLCILLRYTTKSKLGVLTFGASPNILKIPLNDYLL